MRWQGPVFCGMWLPAEPPGSLEHYAPAMLLCHLPWLKWDLQRCMRPSDLVVLRARKAAVPPPAGVFWMWGAFFRGGGARSQLEERRQEACGGMLTRPASLAPEAAALGVDGRCLGGCLVAHSHVWSDSSEEHFCGSSADSRKEVKFGFQCLSF